MQRRPPDSGAHPSDAGPDREEVEHLAKHLIETQGGHAAAVAEGIAASAEASGNRAQHSLWLRIRDAIGKRS